MTKAKPGQPAKKRHEEYAERIIAMLEKRLAPWQRPWGAGATRPPFNPVSGTVYSGINRVMLSEYDMDDPRWMSFKQANQLGYRVKKGEKSQPVVHWQWTDTIEKRDENDNLILDDNGEPEKEVVLLGNPRIRFFSVFHASQLQMENGQPIPPFEPKEPQWQPHERAEAILRDSGAKIIHDRRDKAFYSINKDEIHLPPKDKFGDEGMYYPIALHELSHWTRHPSRLDRESGPFGSESYAREELRAHIASWMLSQDLGIDFNPDHQAAYLQSWVKVLKDDPYEIFRACGDAERIKKYIFGLEKKQEQAADIAFSDLKAEVDTRKWYDDLRKPNNFEYLHQEFVALGPDSDPEQISKMAQVYQSFSARISEIVTDELGDDKILERSRERLTNLLLETHLLHGKMIELGQLPPDSRFPHQELAEAMVAREARPESGQASDTKGAPAEPAREAVYLQVPYKEKNEAKKAGARWDRDKKLWYAPVGADLARLARFVPEKEPAPVQALSPVEELRGVLEANGFALKGDPIMDGQIHRAPIAGKPNQRDGAYQAYADGVPNGWFENHRDGNGTVTKWIYSGQMLSAEQKETLRAEIDRRREQAQKEREEQYAKAADRIFDKFAACAAIPVDPEHPYLKDKDVENHGLLQDQDGNLLLVGIDLDKSHFLNNNPKATAAPRSAAELTLHNQIQTLQTISPDGQKRFEPGSKKNGAMFLIGGDQFRQIYFDQKKPQSLFQDETSEILLAEGYATGASLRKATGLPVAVAFDAGNLKPVAEALRRKFPRADLTICADNDYPLVHAKIKQDLGEGQVTPELEEKYSSHNKGVVKAGEAAKAVNGRVLVPRFTDAEKSRGLTDFNDLARSRGVYAVTRLVHPRHREQAATQGQPAQADRPALSAGLAR